jgi:hypothetical protein
MLKQENYIKSVRHLRGKDLKISLSRVITSETAQLNYLLDKKPTDIKTIYQQHYVWSLQNWRKSLDR